ncbi:hypothetical protein ACLOJK_041206, partial [Asimina triloba]
MADDGVVRQGPGRQRAMADPTVNVYYVGPDTNERRVGSNTNKQRVGGRDFMPIKRHSSKASTHHSKKQSIEQRGNLGEKGPFDHGKLAGPFGPMGQASPVGLGGSNGSAGQGGSSSPVGPGGPVIKV